MKDPQFRTILLECTFKAVRSSGKGGQNVNKVSSKIEITFDLENSAAFSDDEKTLIRKGVGNKISKENLILVRSEESRSQAMNKSKAIEKLRLLLLKCFVKKKKRVPTKVSKSAHEKRLKSKKLRSDLKSLRSGI